MRLGPAIPRSVLMLLLAITMTTCEGAKPQASPCGGLCAEGFACHNAECRFLCNSTFECPRQYVCAQGVCLSPDEAPVSEVVVGVPGESCDGTEQGTLAQCGVSNTGDCRMGETLCSNGVWSECVGAVLPGGELCDGRDNNCDGPVDNAVSDCTEPNRCIGAACVPSSCSTRVCPVGQGCVNDVCVDADCVAVQCDSGQACAQGRCFPAHCAAASCRSNQVCVNEACVDRGCIDVVCAAGQVCANGQCVEQSCGAIPCAQGAACIYGQCIQTECVGVLCAQGERCVNGACHPTACGAILCGQGLVCANGACRDLTCDDPALLCETGDCILGTCGFCDAGAAGSLAADATTVCRGGEATLTLTDAGPGAVWQRSTDVNTWTDVTGVTGSVLQTGALTTQTFYRVAATVPGCPTVTSNVVGITVQESVAGELNAATLSVCAGSGTQLALSGHSGSILWQRSTDAANWVNDLSTTSSTLTTGPLAQTTWFRAQVTLGVCVPAQSNTVQVTADSPSFGGTTAAVPNPVCSGGSATVSLSGHNGVIQWQSSPDAAVWTNVMGATDTSYATSALTETTHFRARVSNGACPLEYSGSTAIGIATAPAQPSSVTGPSSVPAGSTGVAYSIAAVPGAADYLWSVPPNASVASGQGSTAITVDFANDSGAVAVRAANACGASAWQSLSVTVVTPAMQCSGAGGSWQASQNRCYFTGTTCPSGWSIEANWSTTTAQTCVHGAPAQCGPTSTNPCTTGSHSRANVAPETCAYSWCQNCNVGCCCGCCPGGTCTASVIERGCIKN